MVGRGGERVDSKSEQPIADCVVVIDAGGHLAGIVDAAFSDRDVRVLACDGMSKAMECLAEEAVAVTIINSEEDPAPFLEQVAQKSPLTLPVLFDGAPPPLVSTIPDWNRHPFTCMPWQTDLLFRMIDHGVFRYRINKALENGDDRQLCRLVEVMEAATAATPGHWSRVADYSDMMAERLNISPGNRREIRLGSWLHDCGKINMPANSSAYGAVSSFQEVKMHPEWGVELVAPSQQPEVVRNIILYHHERFDGYGYPSGVSGSQIPVEARVVAVADIFDALTSHGSFRKPYSKDKALRMIASMKGNILDEELVEVFCEVVTDGGGIRGQGCYSFDKG